ncbi:homeobox protein Dlx6a-like [Tubulanus polymorphus]|uniref:homeobox protein Dlx6a-like n=1 Tax=Tubulanus polymorphus TaxID=672921 RepID=UPI003DA1FE89
MLNMANSADPLDQDLGNKSAFMEIQQQTMAPSMSHSHYIRYPNQHPQHDGFGGPQHQRHLGYFPMNAMSPTSYTPPGHHHFGMSYQPCTTSPPRDDKSMVEEQLRMNGKGKKMRKPRTIYSSLQLQQLNRRFQRTQYLALPERAELAAALGLTQTQVKIWFQNKRSKLKKIMKQQGTTPGQTAPPGQQPPPGGQPTNMPPTPPSAQTPTPSVPQQPPTPPSNGQPNGPTNSMLPPHSSVSPTSTWQDLSGPNPHNSYACLPQYSWYPQNTMCQTSLLT